MVSGGISEVMAAMKLIGEKLAKEAEKYDDGYTRSKLRLIIPNTSCGWIIGKGGSTIKSFVADSHAGIRISSQDSVTGLKDRLVVVTGSLEERLDAMFLILSKLMEDVHYVHTAFYSFPFAAYNRMNYAQNDVGGRHPRNEGRSSSVASKGQGNSVTIGISDDHIGLVIGHGGRNLSAISQASGAKIRVSERDDFISGTSDRKMTITGSQKAIRVAEDMIMQKVSFVSESS